MGRVGAGGPALAALLLAASSLACDAELTPVDPPAAARAEGGGFILEAGVPKVRWSPEEAIEVVSSLTFVGPAPRQTIWASGSGVVAFAIAEIGGRRRMGGAATADCFPYPYERAVKTAVPFRKSGGWTGDDPDGAFYAAFFRDPQLHLPMGRWRITASVSGFLAECGANAPPLELELAPIYVEVR